ncbi:MAG: AAA family ATPase, partial [Deltaproteobacteria bacterium]
MIINGLDVIPNGIQVMVFSRDEPPAQFARLRANDRICFLGWNDLRLTPEESREIFLRKGQKNLSDEALLSLHEKTDGWAAGLMLLLQDAALRKGESEPFGALPELSREAVFNYLGNEIFSRADEDTQTFWLKTAFLPRVSVPMAEKLTGIHGSEQIMSRLRRCTFLAEKDLTAGPTYHYHPLLKAFLVSHAKILFTA